MSYRSDPSALSSTAVLDEPTRAAPGKRSLTDHLQRRAAGTAPMPSAWLPPSAPDPMLTRDVSYVDGLLLTSAPVQRMQDGHTGLDHAAVHAAASHGVAGAGGPLPHLAAIQRAFGPHDVGGIVAHTDGAAASAAGAIGASAFAFGNHVAFAGTPDLHTAAHEAAHVVQQRAGVHLKGGVGEAGDPYERHADAVADAVVRGDSAVDLLGAPAGDGATGAVQRKDHETGPGELAALPAGTAKVPLDQRSDVRIAEQIMNYQHAVLVLWKTALDNFQMVINSASDKEARPDFNKALSDFVGTFIFGAMVAQGSNLKLHPAAPTPMAVIAGLAGAMDAERKRAGLAAGTAKVRSFFVDHNTQIGALTAKLLGSKDDFLAQVERAQEAPDANHGMMRMALLELHQAIEPMYAWSSAERFFAELTKHWLRDTQLKGTPSQIFIRLDASFTILEARIDGPGGQRLAEQLLRDSPDGVDLWQMEVPRQFSQTRPDGPADYLTVDSNRRVVDHLTSPQGRRILDGLRQRGSLVTKLLTGP